MTFGFPAYHEVEFTEDLGPSVNVRETARNTLISLGWEMERESDRELVARTKSMLWLGHRLIVQFRGNNTVFVRSEGRYFIQYQDYGVHENNVNRFVSTLRVANQQQVQSSRVRGPGTNEYALKKIAIEIAEAARRMAIPGDFLPSYGKSRGFGFPHIEVNIPTIQFVIVENGSEMLRRSTTDYQEFLYWVHSDITARFAEAHERANRVPNQDTRRLQFSKQLELLCLLDPQVAARRKKELDRLVLLYPYRDVPPRS